VCQLPIWICCPEVSIHSVTGNVWHLCFREMFLVFLVAVHSFLFVVKIVFTQCSFHSRRKSLTAWTHSSSFFSFISFGRRNSGTDKPGNVLIA